MSDTWYRDPTDLPPYEDGLGNLWTLDGELLNPINTCDRPEPWDLVEAELMAQLFMGYRETLEAEMRRVLKWPS